MSCYTGSPVVDDGEETEGEADPEGHGHGVLGVGGHALEDFAGTNDGGHNDGETGAGQHNVSSTASSISGTCSNYVYSEQCCKLN